MIDGTRPVGVVTNFCSEINIFQKKKKSVKYEYMIVSGYLCSLAISRF